MTKPFAVSDLELLERTAELVKSERACVADVVEHLAEVDRRRAYLDAACRSLSCYCIERLGYSEDEARKRVQVARLGRRFPQVLEELRSGLIHMTGLSLLATVLSEDNAPALLAEARGKSRSQIEALIARHFPKPDVAERMCPEPKHITTPALAGPGTSGAAAPPAKVAPLSESRWSVQLSIDAKLKAKIDKARQLLSHAVPNGELATLVDRAFDALLEQEKKRRFGAGKPRKQRALKTGSRHIPVELARVIWERDGWQCTFVDAQKNRCSAREGLTLEHTHPFALGGETTADNLCLLCAAHNRHTARKQLGEAQVERKMLESEYERAQRGLRNIGFSDKLCKKALAELRKKSRATGAKQLIVEALAVLVPNATPSMVRDSSYPRWPLRTARITRVGPPGQLARWPGRADVWPTPSQDRYSARGSGPCPIPLGPPNPHPAL